MYNLSIGYICVLLNLYSNLGFCFFYIHTARNRDDLTLASEDAQCSIHGSEINLKQSHGPVGSIAQLAQRRSRNSKVRVQIPPETTNFFVVAFAVSD